MKIFKDGAWKQSRLVPNLFYKNLQFVRDERNKNDELYNGDTAKISEANMNFLKEHIKSKEQLYQLMDEYYNDNNTYSIWQPESQFEFPNEQLFGRAASNGFKRILSDAHELKTTNIDGWDELPVFDEYARLINHKSDLLIVELGPGRGRGLRAIAKNLKPDSIIICVDIDFYYVKRVDAIAENMGLSNRMCGYKANFWNLPFSDESVDVVCTCKGLEFSYEINRTVQEISRVLKKDGRFVCNSWRGGLSGISEKDFFDYLDLPDDEYKTLYRKAKMFTGLDDLVDLAKANNLCLSSHKIFEGDKSLGGDDEISVFEKKLG